MDQADSVHSTPPTNTPIDAAVAAGGAAGGVGTSPPVLKTLGESLIQS
jgi:hypothetical protein